MSSSTASSAKDAEFGSENEAPIVSALFLMRFDKKIGYTIAWKRSSVDVPLDGAVEYKSLPSGLHGIDNDLVYFVHEGYAGLSAFARGEGTADERNANFVAVGILVDKKYGRLGRSWLCAKRLEGLARALADNASSTAPLEEFWEEQSTQPELVKKHSRSRALSTITAVISSEQSLPPYHPARSILQYIDVFGPLIFRLQQAALLRKRILFVGAPPVRATCEFVYNLSVLSSIAPHDRELLSPGTESLFRLPALFSIGVHDIPLLEQLASSKPQPPDAEVASPGWVACTTDEIIATKAKLYDVIVELPAQYDAPRRGRPWPRVRTADGVQIKASQRDVWRYRLLHHELWKHLQKRHDSHGTNGTADTENESAALLPNGEASDDGNEANDDFNESYDDSGVEPVTWSRLAYSGFIWWASAGEQDADTARERERDREILGDLSAYREGLHTAMIAYFHRSTGSLINDVHKMVQQADAQAGGGDDDDDDEAEALTVDRDDISRMGLDTWSEADRAFLQEFVWMYFGRLVDVQGANLECCGMRIPIF